MNDFNLKANSHESKSLTDTGTIAQKFLEKIESVHEVSQTGNAKAAVVGLIGNLGSGKTTFTKAIGSLLGVEQTIQSPTFVIQKSYDTTNTKFKKFYHLDLYRLENAEETKMLRLDEVFANPQNLVFIEWPEKITLPQDAIRIMFEFVDETTRIITF